MNIRSLTTVFVFAVLLGTTNPGQSAEHKKSHFEIRDNMENTGLLPEAKGRLELKQSDSGKAGEQRLEIRLEDLEAETSYQLVASVDDTNTFTVVEFTTDHEGKARLDLSSKEKKLKSKPGEVKAPLPEELNPISGDETLSIVDAAQQPVLNSDLSQLDKFHIDFKQHLESGEIRAKLEVKANNKKGHVKLDADGLTPLADYSLSLNGTVIETATARADGKVVFHVDFDEPLEIATLTTVELLDGSGTVVLSASL